MLSSATHDRLLHGVGRRVGEVRRKAGLTQEQLGARIGTTMKNVQRIEGGRQNLTLATLARLAHALGAAVDELVAAAPSSPARASGIGALPVVPGPLEGGMPSRVPILSPEVAGGPFAREGQLIDVMGWTLVPRPGLEGRAFICQVRGASMEPVVPDGSFNLFRRGPAPVEPGRLLLLETRAIGEGTGGLTLKRVAAVEKTRQGARVRLESFGAAKALTVDIKSADDLRVVGEWLGVVGLALSSAD